MRRLSGSALWLALILMGCGSKTGEERPFDWVPLHLSDSIPYPERNPITESGVALGRELFYDPILSGNNEISCASCHLPELAFSDGLVISDKGASGEPLLRHTPSLMNLAWMDGLFWDGGGYDLESQAFAPIKHPDEMNQDLNELLVELQEHDSYPSLFQEAFSDGLNLPNIVRALAQFERTLVSGDAPFDRVITEQGDEGLTDDEWTGYGLVQNKCSPCHVSHFFTDFSYRNNGLDAEYSDEHEHLAWGRARITLDPDDMGKYKVPSLRNVTLTAPYMHDGRFASLNDVLDHYVSGVQESPTLDPSLQGEDGSVGIALTSTERTQIIAFLGTLSDTWLLSAPRFGPPGED